MNQRYLTSIDELDDRFGLSRGERDQMDEVCEKFPFRTSEYYLSLIDWEARNDLLHRIVIPDPRELKGGGSLDPSSEKDLIKMTGVQHK